MSTTQTDRSSAVIYEFPKRGRFAMSGAQTSYVADDAFQRAPQIEFGGSWYHDAAIEAERRSH